MIDFFEHAYFGGKNFFQTLHYGKLPWAMIPVSSKISHILPITFKSASVKLKHIMFHEFLNTPIYIALQIFYIVCKVWDFLALLIVLCSKKVSFWHGENSWVYFLVHTHAYTCSCVLANFRYPSSFYCRHSKIPLRFNKSMLYCIMI